MPRLESIVSVVSATVPVPVAGLGEEEPELAEALRALELLDADDWVAALGDDVELPDGGPKEELPEEDCNRLCTSDTNWELTRCKAVPLAILDRPFDRVTSALPITLISAVSAAED